MKKILAMTLTLAMTIGLMACGGGAASSAASSEAAPASSEVAAPASSEAAAPESSEAPAEEAAPAEEDLTQGDKIQMNLASTFPAEGFVHQMFVYAKEEIEEKTGGRIEVIIHPAGALGSTKEIIEGVKEGTIEASGIGDEDLDPYAPNYSVFSTPYLFRDADHFVATMREFSKEGGLFDQIAADYTGQYSFAWACRGARDVTANKEIIEPGDLAGLKFRLPQSPIRIAVFEAYGASPTVVDFSELYMALKTGTCDAQENPPETIYTYKYYEAQKYLALTEHIFSPARVTVSKVWFDKLDPKDQKVIRDAFNNATERTYEENPNPDEEYLKLCEEQGMQIITPNKQAFIDTAAPVVQKWAEDNWEPGLLDMINSL